MRKIFYCHQAILQFVCAAFAVILLTVLLGYHLIKGTLPLFVGILMSFGYGMLCRMTVLAWKEMIEELRNYEE